MVDDARDDYEAVVRVLGQLDASVEVDWSEGADEALAKLERPAPGTLVLLDLNLIPSSGLDLLAKLRQRESTRTTPVLVYTSSNRADDVSASYALGANAYHVKASGAAALRAQFGAILRYWFEEARVP